MAEYISVRSNWTSINSVSLDLVCDVDIEENNQTTVVDKQEEPNDDINSRLVIKVFLKVYSVLMTSKMI